MLIVSAYYNIPSKASYEFYYCNIKRFFENIKAQILFFTDHENYQCLKDIAGKNVQFQIQEFSELSIFKTFPPAFWQEQIKIDPQKYHTWQLGAIWANKSRFVQEAMYICESEWYMWVDAGSLREDYPQIEKFGSRTLPDTFGIYLQLLKPLTKTFFSFPDWYIAASHILFHKDYINQYVSLYDETLKIYEEEKIPLIVDQYIIASMVPNAPFIHTILVDPDTLPIYRWFFFYLLF